MANRIGKGLPGKNGLMQNSKHIREAARIMILTIVLLTGCDTKENPPTFICGNTIVESNETCDDGPNNGAYAHCLSNCSGPGPHCGDGLLDAGYELCDGDCPTSCTPQACSTASLLGTVATCDAHCEYAPIVSCVSGDGCCPSGCSPGSDADCGPDCTIQEFRDVQIPMRDGQTLAAFIRVPTDAQCKLPTILLQTPYDKENARSLWFQSANAEPLFDSLDYVFAVVDWRGFFGSTDAGTTSTLGRGKDGFDTVEWIATQPWSDGKVGTWGVSALGVQQFSTAATQPPHLIAAVPIFTGQNTTYQQYYPGGVLRREYYTFISLYYGPGIITDHPYRDLFWLLAEVLFLPADVKVPMLLVSGWYDLYPKNTLQTFNALVSSSDPQVRAQHRLLIGDWIHFAIGGETGAGRAPTAQELKYHDLERRVQSDSLAFFDFHLRGLANEAATWTPVRYVRSGEGVWASSDTWPPSGTTPRTLYLSADGNLVDSAPTSSQLSFPYDPADPSPTKGGGTLLPIYAHGPADQSAVIARPDAVTFVSETLNAPLRIHGAISVALDVSTTGPDTDFAVRLTDVDTSGAHLLIGEGIRRLKLRGDFVAPLITSPDTRYSIVIDLTADLAYTFAAGHRVGLIISSSNYARFDRNPNTGDDFWDTAGSGVPVTNTLYLDGSSTLVMAED